MPSINTASQKVTNFPYQFVSPFSHDTVDVLYSSINFVNPKESACLPCVVCGNSVARQNAIDEQASRYKNYTSNNQTTIVVGRV